MIEQVEIDLLKFDDYRELITAMKASYSQWQGSFWSEDAIKNLIKKFPEGQIVIRVGGVVVGCALSLIVDYKKFGDKHTYRQITGNYTFNTHNSNGDTLYGIEIFIHPDYRGLRLGRRLYDARKELCERLNLKAIIFGGRLPDYHKYATEMSPKEYIQKVRNKELFDPVLSFQLANDFHIRRVLHHYLPEDRESREYATLMQWLNAHYDPDPKNLFSVKTFVRLGLIQWQMRPYKDIDEMFTQVEYFVDAVAAYQSDFALFPELFNGPLLAGFNHLSEAEAMRELALYTPEITRRFRELAIRYNVNIITGSFPSLEDNILKNIGFVCHRSGTLDKYEKIHITPDEAKHWGIQGGNSLKVFDTDSGRIGVLICYDVEFPELSRLLADEGMEILFVPFLTDTQNAYMRVRLCAQARAIENECFVAIAGSVGNLPKVANMDIQYSQAAVFTPSDFGFPSNCIKTEATANTEMILISEVDLSLLHELHEYGSVRNLKDRRKDFYKLQMQEKKSN